MIKRKKRKMADNLPKGFRITENDTYRYRKQMKYPEGIRNFSVNGKTCFSLVNVTCL